MGTNLSKTVMDITNEMSMSVDAGCTVHNNVALGIDLEGARFLGCNATIDQSVGMKMMSCISKVDVEQMLTNMQQSLQQLENKGIQITPQTNVAVSEQDIKNIVKTAITNKCEDDSNVNLQIRAKNATFLCCEDAEDVVIYPDGTYKIGECDGTTDINISQSVMGIGGVNCVLGTTVQQVVQNTQKATQKLSNVGLNLFGIIALIVLVIVLVIIVKTMGGGSSGSGDDKVEINAPSSLPSSSSSSDSAAESSLGEEAEMGALVAAGGGMRGGWWY